MKLELEVETLEFKIAATKKLPMTLIIYQRSGRVLIHATLREKDSLSVDTD